MAGGAAGDRVDGNGFAYAGSQRQTQLWVNTRQAEFDAALAEEFPELDGATIEWRSPLAEDRYAEYQDQAFLDSVGLSELSGERRNFWPDGGPVWDALATVTREGTARPGVVLGEGKSYPEEMQSNCSAKAENSLRQIEESLAWTQRQLGITNRTGADWMRGYYQSANRLAHLTWLRSLGVRAWLVHLLFVDDPHSPTTAVEWETAVKAANATLGIGDAVVPGAGHVFLAADASEPADSPERGA